MRILSSLQFLVIILFYTVTGSMQAAEPLSPFEVIPQAIVGECVDTTSGMYFEQEEDVAISSINELALKRTYTSEWGEWRFFPHCTLVHGTQSQTGKELIHTFDSNGTPLQLIVSSSNSTEYLFKFETPIQNAARGILTGRAHFSDCKGHVNKDLITLQLPDGAVRTYEKFSTTQPDLGPLCAKPNHSALSNTTFYRLTSEQLPSQNILRYRYNRDGYLQAVDLIDSREKLYASITFQYQENQAHAFVNDQLMVSYSFQNGLLSSATRIKKQSITYTYEPVGGKRRLVKKEFPEGRSIHLSYTADGKVAAITPSGYTVPLYQFEYSQNATNVIHSNKSTTRYTYKDRLLSTIEFSDGLAAAAPDKRKDTFIWNAAADEANVHTLKGCTLRSYQNNNSKIAQAIRYEYQKNENASIVQQDVYKIPLLDHTSSISLDAKGLPTGKNKNRLTSSFSRTRPWQLRSQEDEHGTTTTYSYFGNSNHIKKILITKNNKVQHRQFFKYDETTGALLKTIVDDGSKKTSNELDDITTRHIKTIKQKWSWRRGDYLEQIDEFRYDPISQKEYLTATVKQTFDSSGNLLKRELVDTEGATAKVEEFAYDIHDNCIREVNALGETTHYHFDTNDNCIQVQRPGLITLFTYDLANRPSTTKECYDDGYTVTTRNIYNDQENCIERVDRYGNTTKYKYDASSRCRSIIHPRTRMYASGALNTPIDNFIYDIFGNCTTATQSGQTEKYAYNLENKPTSIYHHGDVLDYIHYTRQGQIKKLNSNRILTSYSYDNKQNVTSIDTHTLTNDKKQGESLSSMKFAYINNQCVKETHSSGRTLLRTYDHYGRLQSEAEENTKIKREYQYDTLHRLSQIKRWIDDKEYITEHTRYDALDRINEQWIKEPDGSITSHTTKSYDSFGNVTETLSGLVTEQITYVEGTKPHIITNSYGGITRIDYNEVPDTFGQKCLQIVVTNPQGVTTTHTFNAIGQKIEENTKNPFGVIIAQQKMLYDFYGNLGYADELLLTPEGKQVDCRPFGWKYNSSNILETMNEGGRLTNYKYNSLNQLVGERKYVSDFSYEYTAAGELSRICKDRVEIAKFTYDKTGNISKGTTSGKNATEREYSPQGWITAEIISDEWGSYKVSYSYDGLGRMTKILLPDSSSIEYHYLGSKLQAVVRKNKEDQESYKHQYTKYTEQGFPTEEILFTNDKRTRSYSPSGGLESLESRHLSERILERDLIGNPTKVQRDDQTATYSYDYLGHLASENDGEEHTYTYDSLQNVLSHNSEKSSYDQYNQLIKKDINIYEYDVAGNLYTISSNRLKTTLRYTPFNQLSNYKKDSTEVEYSWDTFGRRTSRKEGATVHRFFFVGNCEIGSLNKEGEIIELKVPERIIDQEAQGTIAIELQSRIFLPNTDLLGNIVSLYYPRNRRIVESYEYTAFGKERVFNDEGRESSTSFFSNPWRYRGLRTDPVTHFVCFGFRDYDPSIQRFLTRDPLGFADGFNPYVYALNNPISYSDVYGLKAVYGACLCHPECEYYRSGKCGHDAGVLLYDDDEASDTLIQGMARSFREFLRPFQTVWDNHADRIKGIGHGIADFGINSIHDLQTAAFHIGSRDSDLFDLQERLQMQSLIEQAQNGRKDAAAAWIMRQLSVDPSNELYQSYRSGTTTTLEVAALVSAVYGAGKGIMAFRRLSQLPGKAAHLTQLGNRSTSKILSIEQKINTYLGEGTKLIKNKAGDPVFLSQNGQKRVRFDFKNSGKDIPHMHIEKKSNIKWEDATSQHRIYPLKE